jgi:hypothetical protein
MWVVHNNIATEIILGFKMDMLLSMAIPVRDSETHHLQYSTAQHSTAQHSTAQHSTAQHSTAQHSIENNTWVRGNTRFISSVEHDISRVSAANKHPVFPSRQRNSVFPSRQRKTNFFQFLIQFSSKLCQHLIDLSLAYYQLPHQFW